MQLAARRRTGLAATFSNEAAQRRLPAAGHARPAALQAQALVVVPIIRQARPLRRSQLEVHVDAGRHAAGEAQLEVQRAPAGEQRHRLIGHDAQPARDIEVAGHDIQVPLHRLGAGGRGLRRAGRTAELAAQHRNRQFALHLDVVAKAIGAIEVGVDPATLGREVQLQLVDSQAHRFLEPGGIHGDHRNILQAQVQPWQLLLAARPDELIEWHAVQLPCAGRQVLDARAGITDGNQPRADPLAEEQLAQAQAHVQLAGRQHRASIVRGDVDIVELDFRATEWPPRAQPPETDVKAGGVAGKSPDLVLVFGNHRQQQARHADRDGQHDHDAGDDPHDPSHAQATAPPECRALVHRHPPTPAPRRTGPGHRGPRSAAGWACRSAPRARRCPRPLRRAAVR